VAFGADDNLLVKANLASSDMYLTFYATVLVIFF
jgi:hypothetical protein